MSPSKLAHLCHILKHCHSGHLFLNDTIVVDLVAKLGPVSSMVNLGERGKKKRKYRDYLTNCWTRSSQNKKGRLFWKNNSLERMMIALKHAYAKNAHIFNLAAIIAVIHLNALIRHEPDWNFHLAVLKIPYANMRKDIRYLSNNIRVWFQNLHFPNAAILWLDTCCVESNLNKVVNEDPQGMCTAVDIIYA